MLNQTIWSIFFFLLKWKRRIKFVFRRKHTVQMQPVTEMWQFSSLQVRKPFMFARPAWVSNPWTVSLLKWRTVICINCGFTVLWLFIMIENDGTVSFIVTAKNAFDYRAFSPSGKTDISLINSVFFSISLFLLCEFMAGKPAAVIEQYQHEKC